LVLRHIRSRSATRRAAHVRGGEAATKLASDGSARPGGRLVGFVDRILPVRSGG
jgi:hypothetical protein